MFILMDANQHPILYNLFIPYSIENYPKVEPWGNHECYFSLLFLGRNLCFSADCRKNHLAYLTSSLVHELLLSRTLTEKPEVNTSSFFFCFMLYIIITTLCESSVSSLTYKDILLQSSSKCKIIAKILCKGNIIMCNPAYG